MASIRLHCPSTLRQNHVLDLNKQQVHYLFHVMRQHTGDTLIIFNEIDGNWEATISSISKKNCQLLVTSQLSPPLPSPDIWLCFTPVKQAPMHYLIQKATELGVSKFIPVMTQRCIVKNIKTDKYQANALEAAEQSNRTDIPEIASPTDLRSLLESWPADRTLLMADETGHGEALPTLLHSLAANSPLALLIGPEGGFSPKEFELCTSYPYIKRVTLGPRILRADTAAICGLSVCISQTGDWEKKPSFR